MLRSVQAGTQLVSIWKVIEPAFTVSTTIGRQDSSRMVVRSDSPQHTIGT